MSAPLLLQTLRWQRVRALILMAATFAWGWLMVFIFTTFSPAMRQLARANPMFEQFSQFGSGNLFTLPGSITLGFQHPLLIAMMAVIAVGASAVAVAGERQSGTLELLLARPLSRTGVVMSMLVALLTLVALLLVASMLGTIVGIRVHDLVGDVDLARMPLVYVNGLLLWGAFTTFGLAASVTFDRPGPALGLSLGYLIVNYFVEVLGSLWSAASWTQQYSLFHRFQASKILTATAEPIDFVVLGVALVVPIVYALLVFPRRDLAAPS